MGSTIDISYWQGKIDWDKAKKDVDLVIHRASIATSKDEKFAENAKEMEKRNIPYGVYHYMINPSEYMAKLEADTLLRTIKGTKARFVVIDVEQAELIWKNGKSLPMHPMLLASVKAFIARIRSQCTCKIGFYGGESVYNYGNLEKAGFDFLWFANYSKQPSNRNIALWQYSSKGRISGINTNVDMNKWVAGKLSDFQSYTIQWKGEASPSPAPTVEPNSDKGDEKKPAVPSLDVNGDGQIVRISEPTVWNVRKNPDAQTDSVGIVKQGEEFEYIATAWNGWLGIWRNGEIQWVTGKAGKVVRL